MDCNNLSQLCIFYHDHFDESIMRTRTVNDELPNMIMATLFQYPCNKINKLRWWPLQVIAQLFVDRPIPMFRISSSKPSW